MIGRDRFEQSAYLSSLGRSLSRAIIAQQNQSQSPSAHTDGGMHKSSEHSDKDCVWMKMHPPYFRVLFFRQACLWSSSPQALFVFHVDQCPGGKEYLMKIRVLYEDDIKNGHKNYTTIQVPDGDYSITLDIDYERKHACRG